MQNTISSPGVYINLPVSTTESDNDRNERVVLYESNLIVRERTMENLDRSGLISLHLYNVYANNLVLDVAAGMTMDELSCQTSPSHGSVINLLRHMLGCEYFFLLLCMGTKPEESDEEQPDLIRLREYFEVLADRHARYLKAVADYELTTEIHVPAGKGEYTLPRWQLLAQSLIHSAHHRGELSIVMTGLGHPLPTLDPLLMYIKESGQTWQS